MGFFIVIACSWLVVALLEVLAFRRQNDLQGADLVPVSYSTESTYLYPPNLN